jgi:membrane protein
MRQFMSAIRKAVKDFSDDECMTSGAAIAYYTIFSLPPLLVVVFFIAGQFGVSEATIDRVIKDQLGMPLTDEQTQQAAEGGIGGGAIVERLGPLGKVIGIAILVFSATGVFAQLQFALNRAWEVEADPHRGGVLRFVLKRLLSLGMIIVIAFLLLVSFVLTTMIDELVQSVLGKEPGPAGLIMGEALNGIVTQAVGTLLFAAMFNVLPDARMRWRDTWVGAGITAFLFVVGKAAIGLYLNNADVGSAWGGAAAAMIALLVWVYYSVLIVLFGAELTQAWANRIGSGIEPERGAVRIVEEKHRLEAGRA